jgi:hypothetical protein
VPIGYSLSISFIEKKIQKIKHYNFQCVDFTHSHKNSIKNLLFKVLKSVQHLSIVLPSKTTSLVVTTDQPLNNGEHAQVKSDSDFFLV